MPVTITARKIDRRGIRRDNDSQEGGRLLTVRHRYEEYYAPVLPGCAAQSSMLP